MPVGIPPQDYFNQLIYLPKIIAASLPSCSGISKNSSTGYPQRHRCRRHGAVSRASRHYVVSTTWFLDPKLRRSWLILVQTLVSPRTKIRTGLFMLGPVIERAMPTVRQAQRSPLRS